MIKDNQPIHNLGFGATSRDMPDGEKPREGVSPDSSFITRALDGHPIMKMATALIGTGIAAHYATQFMKEGGLKLGLTLTEKAAQRDSGLLKSGFQKILNTRDFLDDIEGVANNRVKDALVYRNSAGKLTTGYGGSRAALTAESIARESGTGWAFRDSLQTRLVKQARTLPYAVPAFYAADQVVNKRILGNRDPNDKIRNPNQKWYNPTSHIANFAKDIAKTTAMQMGGFMLPGALAGAAKETSTAFFNEQLQNIDNVVERGTAGYAKQKIAYAGFSVKAMLQEIGHDSADLIDKTIGLSQRSTGALATAWNESNRVSRNPVADLYKQRHGPGGVSESARPGSSLSKSKRAAGIAKTIFNGNNEPLSNQMSNESLLDMIPGYKAIRVGAEAGKRQFRTIQDAQKILRDTSQFNSIIANYKDPDAYESLSTTLQTIQKNANSPLTRVSNFLGTYGRFEVDSDGKGKYLAGKKFGEIVERNQYKKILKNHIINGESGVSEKAADKFVRSLQIVDNLEGNSLTSGRQRINPFNRLMMGSEPIHEDDFFETLLSRYNESKYGSVNPLGIKGDALKDAIRRADTSFLENNTDTEAKIASRWNSVYSDYATSAGESQLQPGKLKRSDFDGTSINAVKRKYLKTRAAKVLGADVATLNDETAVNSLLHKNGIDPFQDDHLRAFLSGNKQMSTTGESGILGFLGFKKAGLTEYGDFLNSKTERLSDHTVKIDGSDRYFITRSKNSAVQNAKRQNANFRTFNEELENATATTSTLPNVYKYQGKDGKYNKFIDLNPIVKAGESIASFLTNEIKAPIVNFNPLKLLGADEFLQQRKAGDFQVIGGMTQHPFIEAQLKSGEIQNTDLLTWHRTGGKIGSVGKVTKYGLKDGRLSSSVLEGEYRPLSTTSKGMFATNANYAAGTEKVKPEHGKKVLDAEGNQVLKTTRLDRIKNKLNYDTEQSGSVFRYAGRILNRRFDVNNESVMEQIIGAKSGATAAEAESFTVGGFGRKKSLKLLQENSGRADRFTLINAEANPVTKEHDIIASHAQLMEAFTGFANNTLSQGTHRAVSAGLFGEEGGLIEARKIISEYAPAARQPGNIANSETADRVMSGLRQHLGVLKEEIAQFDPEEEDFLRAQAQEKYETLSKAFHSRFGKFDGLSDLDYAKQSRMFEHSPSVITTADEFSTELTRYLVMADAVVSGNPAQTMANASSVIEDLAEKGIITASQKAEAQVSMLSTVFNLSAFTTYKQGAGSSLNNLSGSVQTNFSRRFEEARHLLSTNKELLTPFNRGTVAQPRLGGTGFSNPVTSKIIPIVKRNLAPSKYKFANTASPISSDANYTFVPTFKTSLNRNPVKTLLSATGIKTNGNEQGFSLASVPMSHGFGRLNRYFGTLGAGVDINAYSGPISMFSAGLTGQRVLPALAIGTAALAVDRTAGGLVNPKDDRGERVYSPLALGGAARVGVEARSIMSGITPGGMNRKEKKDQLLRGETAVRQGRWWALGNTPFKGGKIQYFRPSWYRRMQAAPTFTPEAFGNPIEKAAFYNDFSPLRPLDPYRFERKHYEDRPYPLTGEYFSGPFGPLTPALNMTVGKVLKPQKVMHKEEVDAALASYVPAGQGGAYLPQQQRIFRQANIAPNPQISYAAAPPPNIPRKPFRNIPTSGFSSGSYGGSGSALSASTNAIYARSAGATYSAGNSVRNQLSSSNVALANNAGPSQSSSSSYSQLGSLSLAQSVSTRSGGSSGGVYGPPVGPMMMPEKIVSAGLPLRSGSNDYLKGDLGYKLQETAGIYGFMEGQTRKSLGMGAYDFEPDRPVLQSASEGYGSTRAFWDLNLGGMGDLPLPSEGALGNIELSEIARRFVPHKRSTVNMLNPIKNTMGKKYPFLPGSENFTDFTTGDPFTKVPEGEMRLPGIGYERLNKLYPDRNGRYGAVNQLDILADVAPYSKEYRNLDRRIDKIGLSEEERAKVGQIRAQQNAIKNSKTNFTAYDDSSFTDKVLSPFSTARNAALHTDNFINNKFTGRRNATEDWERKNVYGSTFPEWQRPVESFVKPIYYKGTQRNPLLAAAIGGFAFRQFAQGKAARAGATVVGALTVGGYSAFKKLSGNRAIPMQRKKELALEEYSDILTYTKNRTAASRASQMGDVEAAKQYMAATKKTMYGTDLDSTSIDRLAAGVPKRKRDHFKAMIQAPPSERKRILSTAGRLERRIYEAAWGMPVERKPDLTEYFQTHELPGKDWEGWHPNTNMEHVKIKMGQSMGLEMSQMGYYPQQIKEANLTNPSYPEFGNGKKMGNSQDVKKRLQSLMYDHGINGTISESRAYSGSGSVNIKAGVR
jgi:hypothetical protein